MWPIKRESSSREEPEIKNNVGGIQDKNREGVLEWQVWKKSWNTSAVPSLRKIDLPSSDSSFSLDGYKALHLVTALLTLIFNRWKSNYTSNFSSRSISNRNIRLKKDTQMHTCVWQYYFNSNTVNYVSSSIHFSTNIYWMFTIWQALY